MKHHVLWVAAFAIGAYLLVKHFYGSLSGFTAALSGNSTSSVLGVPTIATANVFQGSGTLAPSQDYYAQHQAVSYSRNPAAVPNNVAVHTYNYLPPTKSNIYLPSLRAPQKAMVN